MDDVHFDYIQYYPALNGSKYLLHFIDTHSGYHVVQDLKDKSAQTIQPILLGFAQWVLNQGSRIRKLHSDDDTAIKSIKQYLQHRGMELSRSSPHNHGQNGHAERAGGILTILIRTILTHAGLPEALWPWIAQAAAYILNRRPTARLKWRTPTEIFLKKPSSLRSLYIIGCKAYVLKKTIPKGDKLSPRVWIGYLVGFQATNIWHIWDPVARRVFSAHDVTFDEFILYKDTQKNIPQPQQRTQDENTLIAQHEITLSRPPVTNQVPFTAPPIFDQEADEPPEEAETTQCFIPEQISSLPTPPDSTEGTPQPDPQNNLTSQITSFHIANLRRTKAEHSAFQIGLPSAYPTTLKAI